MMISPKGIRVMAVLHLLLALGAFFRIGADFDAIKTMRQLKPMKDSAYAMALMDDYTAYVQRASMYYLVDILIAIILAGLLISAGVMLFRRARLGRTLSLTYAVVSIASRFGLTVWYAFGVHPKHAEFLSMLHVMNPLTATVIPIPSSSGWWVGLLVLSIYPLWVWWYLRKDEVRSYLED
jgi:hypothetical protein